jgi:L-cystine transport system permease protein
MNFQIGMFLQCLHASFLKIPVTLGIASVALLLGLLLGTPIALVRVFKVRVLDLVFTILVAVVKAIPVNLIILIAGLWFNSNFNLIARTLGFSITVADVNKVYVAIFAMSIAAIALISESVRGALMSVPIGQYEAGYAAGLTGFQTLRRIVMPQAFLVLIPTLIGNINSLIKLSALVILVGVQDVLNAGLKVASSYYCYLEAYMAAAVIYWAISIICIQAGKLTERNLGRYRRSQA